MILESIAADAMGGDRVWEGVVRSLVAAGDERLGRGGGTTRKVTLPEPVLLIDHDGD